MIWLNLKTCILRHPNYIGAEPVARATWLNILAFCCEQENGGRIVGARKWKDRQWQQTCGVFLEEVNSAPSLLRWDGDDLIAWEYPSEKEGEIQAKREAGRTGGKRSGEARKKQTGSTTRSTASSTTRSIPSTEGKGREGNRKGREEENAREDEELCDPAGFEPPIEIFVAAAARYSVPEWYARKRWEVFSAKGWAIGKTPAVWQKMLPLVKRDFVNDGCPMTESTGPIPQNGKPRAYGEVRQGKSDI